MKPRISLICVVLNVAKYIRTTIENVQAQTCREWEFIIIDGASTDGTQKIVAQYAARDSRIKFKSEPDEGPWDATEKGVAMAQGEFMMIIAGQDGFLDNQWFAKCLKVFDEDKSISLVWASTRGMRDDGTLLPEEHITYSHFIKPEGSSDAARHVIGKTFLVLRDLLLGGSRRRKILIKKIFSKNAIFKLNFLMRRDFPGDVLPRKEDWFRYWLDTGITFSEQPMCVSKQVYLECVPKYPRGTGKGHSDLRMNHLMDFFYNFNSRGYLSYYIPVLAGFGRFHPGNSGDVIPNVLQNVEETYLNKVFALRKRILGEQEEMIFVDRNGKEVSRRKF